MKHQFAVEGMSCSGCVNMVKMSLEELTELKTVEVQLDPPQASFESDADISLETLNAQVKSWGAYELKEISPAL
jgi:copper chaperone CopZ